MTRERDEWTKRDERQKEIGAWAIRCFGAEEALSLPQRGLRLLEEAIECFQACGGDPAQAHKYVDFVFQRDKDPIARELGGVAVCVLALAEAAGLSAEACELDEVVRVLSKPPEHFAARNAAKNAAGFRAAKPKKLTELFVIPVVDTDNYNASTWAKTHCDHYGFDYDQTRCRTDGVVYAWPLNGDTEADYQALRDELRADHITYQTIHVDFDEWVGIPPEARTP